MLKQSKPTYNDLCKTPKNLLNVSSTKSKSQYKAAEKRRFYAKSSVKGKIPPTVTEHCDAVATLAAEYGEPLGLGKSAYICGLFHDFGKRSDLFQQVLHGTVTGIDHAGPGAAALWSCRMPKEIIEVVAGHHAGLVAREVLEPYLSAICRGDPQTIALSGKTPSLIGKQQMQDAMSNFMDEHPGFAPQRPEAGTTSDVPWKSKLLRMMQTRMLYSCQVDADYTISAQESDTNEVGFHE